MEDHYRLLHHTPASIMHIVPGNPSMEIPKTKDLFTIV
jgi:hypothetical protein